VESYNDRSGPPAAYSASSCPMGLIVTRPGTRFLTRPAFRGVLAPTSARCFFRSDPRPRAPIGGGSTVSCVVGRALARFGLVNDCLRLHFVCLCCLGLDFNSPSFVRNGPGALDVHMFSSTDALPFVPFNPPSSPLCHSAICVYRPSAYASSRPQ